MNGTIENENRISDKKAMRKLFPIGVTIALLLIVLLAALKTVQGLGWFAQNEEVGAEGMTIVPADGPLDLAFPDTGTGSLVYPFASVTNMTSVLNAAGYKVENADHGHITTDADHSLLMFFKKAEEVTDPNDSDDQYIISPGSYGSVTFYLIPREEDVSSVRISLRMGGIRNVTGSSEPPTWLPQNDEALTFLQGHILFFEQRSADGIYTGWLGNEINYVFSEHQSDKTTVNGVDWYEVSFCWVWPKTFSQLAYTSGSSYLHLKPLFTADSDELRDLTAEMTDHPEKFFKNREDTPEGEEEDYAALMASPGTNYNYIALSNGYNTVDQLIGDRMEYFVFLINADAVLS